MSLLGNIQTGVGLLTQLAQLRQPSAISPALAVKQMSVPRLATLPGAGFVTGGSFGTSSSGQSFVNGGMRKKRRTTNPTNVKALRRALRRVEGFVKIEKRVDKIVNKLGRSRRTANRSGFVKRKR